MNEQEHLIHSINYLVREEFPDYDGCSLFDLTRSDNSCPKEIAKTIIDKIYATIS